MPADKHGDTSPENIEPCSLLLHQPTASPAKRSARVAHVPAAEARPFLLHHHFSSSLPLLGLSCRERERERDREREREILLKIYR